MDIELNEEQRLYVYRSEDGVTCRGFESLFEETNELARQLRKPEFQLEPDLMGTLEAHRVYDQAIRYAQQHPKKLKGLWFNPKTPEKVRRALNRAYREQYPVRVFYGDPMTGRDWLEECDVLGRVSKSSGILKLPLLIPEGEISAPAMLDHCIVRMIRATDGKELYRHEGYHRPRFEMHQPTEKGYVIEVRADGVTHARFRSVENAYHWLAFMVGKSFLPTCS